MFVVIVAVAVLSDRINAMQEHQMVHTRDVDAIRVMRALQDKRRKLMKCTRASVGVKISDIICRSTQPRQEHRRIPAPAKGV